MSRDEIRIEVRSGILHGVSSYCYHIPKYQITYVIECINTKRFVYIPRICFFYFIGLTEYREDMPKVVPEYKEDAKKRIIEAAMVVIAERGCDQMTIDDVANKLGVSKGAVYWYYKNKEQLIGAVLNKIQSDMQKVSFESYYNRPLDETLIQMFDRFALTDDKQRAIFFEMFALATRNSDVRQFTREYYEGLVSTIENAIKKEKRKEFRQTEADAHKLALLIVALYSGLQNYELVWMYQNEIRDLWLEGIKILLKPSYSGTYGEEIR